MSRGMSLKSKFLLLGVAGVFATGFMKSGTSADFDTIKDSYKGGASIQVPMFAAQGTRIMDGAMKLALKGSAIPIVGPAIVAPLVSGTYGLLWGWTY